MIKELVVSLFDKNLDWLKEINSDVKITIYRKGELSSHPDEIIVEPNLGRDVHTFFHHIVKNYDTLSDYTFFSQDYPFDHIENYINIINGDKETWDNNTSQYFQGYWGYHWNSIGTMWLLHPSEQFNGYVLKANPDGSPHHHHYLPIVEIWNDLFDAEHPNVFEFTPGGHFSISKEQILTRSLDFYKKIIILLETQEFAPWVIERLEPYIFNPHIKTKL